MCDAIFNDSIITRFLTDDDNDDESGNAPYFASWIVVLFGSVTANLGLVFILLRQLVSLYFQ